MKENNLPQDKLDMVDQNNILVHNVDIEDELDHLEKDVIFSMSMNVRT